MIFNGPDIDLEGIGPISFRACNPVTWRSASGPAVQLVGEHLHTPNAQRRGSEPQYGRNKNLLCAGRGWRPCHPSMQVAQAEGLIAEQGLGSREVLSQQTETKVRSIERGRKVEGRGGGERRRGTLRILEGTPSPFQKLMVHYSELNFLAFYSCSGWKHGPHWGVFVCLVFFSSSEANVFPKH